MACLRYKPRRPPQMKMGAAKPRQAKEKTYRRRNDPRCPEGLDIVFAEEWEIPYDEV